MTTKMGEKLIDYEQQELDKFIKHNNPSKAEIKEFINILIALRERPNKNPQLR